MLEYKTLDLRFANNRYGVTAMGLQNSEANSPVVNDDFVANITTGGEGTLILNFNILYFASRLGLETARDLVVMLARIYGEDVLNGLEELDLTEETENGEYRRFSKRGSV